MELNSFKVKLNLTKVYWQKHKTKKVKITNTYQWRPNAIIWCERIDSCLWSHSSRRWAADWFADWRRRRALRCSRSLELDRPLCCSRLFRWAILAGRLRLNRALVAKLVDNGEIHLLKKYIPNSMLNTKNAISSYSRYFTN